MRKISLAVMLLLASAVLPAGAQTPAENAAPAASPPQTAARYSFNAVNDGFLRLDTVSGQVSLCNQTSAGWACQAVPEDRAALEKEIARLQDEVASLKTQVTAMREPEPPRPPADLSPPSADSERAAELRADLSRAKAAVQSAWQRVVEMIKGIQKDVMPKG